MRPTRAVMHVDTPHHRYFRSKEGRWRGTFRLDITDRLRMRTSSLTPKDRWSMRAMALASRTATLVISTAVDYASRGHLGEVRHTTRMSHLGVNLFRSRETISLADDGLSFRMTGTQAFFPLLWKTAWYDARGVVAADHDGADYLIPYFGETIEQHTRMTSQGLEVVQATAFSRATFLLRWRRPLRTG